MQKWEYLSVGISIMVSDQPQGIIINGKKTPFKGTLPDYYEYLNKLGSEGWEMVTKEGYTCTFKRLIEK